MSSESQKSETPISRSLLAPCLIEVIVPYPVDVLYPTQYFPDHTLADDPLPSTREPIADATRSMN
jgi:hypothetical protein